MNIDKLERANILAKSLIPKVDELLNMSSKSSSGRLADAIWGLSECDEWWYEGGGGKHSYKKIQRLLELSLKELED